MRTTELVGVVRVMSTDTLERVAAALGVEPDRFEVLQACLESRAARAKMVAVLYQKVDTPRSSPSLPTQPLAPLKPRRIAFA